MPPFRPPRFQTLVAVPVPGGVVELASVKSVGALQPRHTLFPIAFNNSSPSIFVPCQVAENESVVRFVETLWAARAAESAKPPTRPQLEPAGLPIPRRMSLQHHVPPPSAPVDPSCKRVFWGDVMIQQQQQQQQQQRRRDGMPQPLPSARLGGEEELLIQLEAAKPLLRALSADAAFRAPAPILQPRTLPGKRQKRGWGDDSPVSPTVPFARDEDLAADSHPGLGPSTATRTILTHKQEMGLEPPEDQWNEARDGEGEAGEGESSWAEPEWGSRKGGRSGGGRGVEPVSHILTERKRREKLNTQFLALRAVVPKVTKVGGVGTGWGGCEMRWGWQRVQDRAYVPSHENVEGEGEGGVSGAEWGWRQ